MAGSDLEVQIGWAPGVGINRTHYWESGWNSLILKSLCGGTLRLGQVLLNQSKPPPRCRKCLRVYMERNSVTGTGPKKRRKN